MCRPMSSAFDSLLRSLKRKISDLAGIDVGDSGVKVVRMQKSRDVVTLLAADILPPIARSPEETGAPFAAALPPRLRGRYACLTVPGQDSIVKLLSFPGPFEPKMEGKLFENLGLKNPNAYRVGYKIAGDRGPRAESRVLAVAVPETELQAATGLLPTGVPAPYSLEVAGLATLTAFAHGPGQRHLSEAVGVIEFGASTSSFALFNRGTLAMVRRFGFGTNRLIDRLTESLGVDRDTAIGIVANNSFDIANTVNEVIETPVRQLVVSRDFVERRENCQVASLYVSGGLVLSHDAVDRIGATLGIEVHTWSPFENVKVADGAVPARLVGQDWRLASAIGACLGTFEET